MTAPVRKIVASFSELEVTLLTDEQLEARLETTLRAIRKRGGVGAMMKALDRGVQRALKGAASDGAWIV